MEQLVARQAHNLEVACSSPASATTNGRNSFIQRDFDHNSFMGVAETRTVARTLIVDQIILLCF